MRFTAHGAAALLVFGLAVTGFAEDAEISDLCAVASVEGARDGESGTPEVLVVACAASQPGVSKTIGIGHQSHTVGGESINAKTTQFGNTSVTTGVVDGQPVSVTTVEIGNVTYTTGQVGGESFSSSTMEIGDITYTTGQSDQ